MSAPSKENLIVALDVETKEKAEVLVDRLYPITTIFKVGIQLFTTCGPGIVEMIHKRHAKVFLDLKFHDIPYTVQESVKTAKAMGVFMLTLHASGGRQMMETAASVKGKDGPILLAVTVLTSMDKAGLKEIGIRRPLLEQVKSLALLAKSCGLDGVVCSAQEITAIRRTCGSKFIIVTPGIRPKETESQDQKRIATPEYAIRSGADYIVIGRPITQADDPVSAIKAVLTQAYPLMIRDF